MDNYKVVYWAAACLVFWAGLGVSDGQLADAVNLICDDAGMTVPQEVLFKRLVSDLMKKGESDGIE